MIPDFDHNDAFLWAIYGLGFSVPLLLTAYALLRSKLARGRYERLRADEVKS